MKSLDTVGRLTTPPVRELKEDLPQRPLPWASAPKDHTPKPKSPNPGVERPSPLAFELQNLFRPPSEKPSSGRGWLSQLARGPKDRTPAPESRGVQEQNGRRRRSLGRNTSSACLKNQTREESGRPYWPQCRNTTSLRRSRRAREGSGSRCWPLCCETPPNFDWSVIFAARERIT